MKGNWKKFVAAGDVHGNSQDPAANKAFFKFVDIWKPDIRVCAGDLWDFRPLRTKATADERRESMRDDYEAGRKWIEQFRATHFLRGNHDERLWDLAAKNDGVLSDYANQAIGDIHKMLKTLECRILPYDRRAGVLSLGHLKIIHGYSAGVNAARRAAQTYGSVLCFHGHSIQHVSIEGIENRMGRMCGCLCKLDMDYVRASLGSLMWRSGYAYGVVNEKTGDYHVWQAEEVNGLWILPSDVVCL